MCGITSSAVFGDEKSYIFFFLFFHLKLILNKSFESFSKIKGAILMTSQKGLSLAIVKLAISQIFLVRLPFTTRNFRSNLILYVMKKSVKL